LLPLKQESWKGRAQAGIEVNTRKRDPTTKASAYYHRYFTSGTAITHLSNSMNSAAPRTMLRTTNEHFKPKAPLEPEAGPARKKPRFRLALSWPLLQALCVTVQFRPFVQALVIKRSLDVDRSNCECLHICVSSVRVPTFHSYCTFQPPGIILNGTSICEYTSYGGKQASILRLFRWPAWVLAGKEAPPITPAFVQL
jgi:hypothetical protein